MGASLMITTAGDDAGRIRGILTAIAPDARTATTDELVHRVAELLEGVRLDNGQTVAAYPNRDDPHMKSAVFAFGPTLLPGRALATLRSIASTDATVTALLDAVIENGTTISFMGSEIHHGAYVRASSEGADDVAFDGSVSTMHDLFQDLDLGEFRPAKGEESVSRDVPIDRFLAAVRDNRHAVEPRLTERLAAFAAMAKRRNARTVYWA